MEREKMVVENSYFEDIQKIWKQNNNGYITKTSNQKAIYDEGMNQFVWRENEKTMAYVVVYVGKDFCEKDQCLNKIKKMGNKVAYIWEIVTDKNYVGRGIASKLIEYIIDKYKGYEIYSCIDINNYSSLKLHEKYGFYTLYEFEKELENKISMHRMLVKIN